MTALQLKAENIRFQRGQRHILEQLSLQLAPGEMLGLIGPNGAGKTSLVRILARLQEASAGQVSLGNDNIVDIPRKALAQKLAYLPQQADVHWPLKVRKLVALGRIPFQSPWQRLSAEDEALIDKAMQECEVEHLKDRCVTELSGGERLRVFLARVFCTGAKTILADEPVAALDPYHQLHTLELLAQHCQRGGNAIVVLHDLNAAAQFCDRLVLLNKGRVIAQGEPEAVLNSDTIRDCYQVNTDIVERPDGRWIIPWQRSESHRD